MAPCSATVNSLSVSRLRLSDVTVTGVLDRNQSTKLPAAISRKSLHGTKASDLKRSRQPPHARHNDRQPAAAQVVDAHPVDRNDGVGRIGAVHAHRVLPKHERGDGGAGKPLPALFEMPAAPFCLA
jgi:hypothetical protein